MGEIVLDRGPEGTGVDWQLPPEAVENLKARVGSPVSVFTQTTELDALVPDVDFSSETVRYATVRGILVDVKPEEIVVYRPQGDEKDGKEVAIPIGIASIDEGSADTRLFAGFRNINSIMIEGKGGEIFSLQPSR